MTDELEHLRNALQGSAPEPDGKARDAAIAAAMAAHGEAAPEGRKNVSTTFQGSASTDRPSKGTPRGANLSGGLIEMLTKAFSWKHVALGGASLAAIAVAAINLPRVMENVPPMRPEIANPAKPAKNTPSTAFPATKATDQQLATRKAPVAEMKTRRLKRFPAGAQVMGARPAPTVVAPMTTREIPASPAYVEQGRDRFTYFEDNPVKRVSEQPVSTFSIDVDTASYAFVRRALMEGHLPPRDAVRTEEIVNYFDYDYPAPSDRTKPFRASVAVLPSPWRQGAKLLHIGIKGYDVKPAERPPANLVFLIDTSGSMHAPDKLPLLIRSFRLMLGQLRDDDTVAIVTYAGSAGTALPPTPVKERAKILSVLENLSAGGSTAGGEGIRQAYALAESAMKKDGINRVILATDGDFNVGIRDPEQLKDFVARKRASGITLTVLGFGRGNYNDRLMQALAQNGNGNAHYIDTLNEARKALVGELGGTLFTIASDVKLQVEFNPATVSEYRLVGYETRRLKREDFNNDRVDAGDIGAGHTVTAIYEFVPRDAKGWLDTSRYATPSAPAKDARTNEYAFLKIRYKLPGEKTSRLLTRPVTKRDEVKSLAEAPDSIRFSIAAATFAQLLRGGKFTGSMNWDDVIALAADARGRDPFGYRAEFLNLVRLAKSAAAMEPQRK